MYAADMQDGCLSRLYLVGRVKVGYNSKKTHARYALYTVHRQGGQSPETREFLCVLATLRFLLRDKRKDARAQRN